MIYRAMNDHLHMYEYELRYGDGMYESPFGIRKQSGKTLMGMHQESNGGVLYMWLCMCPCVYV